MAQSQKLPIRLHHNAYVTRDQEKTRKFYEDVIGMPLVATWCESDELFGKMRTYCHTFLCHGRRRRPGLLSVRESQRSGGIRAEDAGVAVSSHRARGGCGDAGGASRKRIAAAGIKPPDTYVLEHGYCRSVYVNRSQRADPGIHARSSRADKIARDRRADAHQELKRWLAGNHTSNNTYR